LTLARFALFLVVILVVVSAYLRLQNSGIGCPDWPACYGAIGAPQAESDSMAQSAYQRIVQESTAPLAWAAPLHRLVASVLGLCMMFLALLSLRARRYRLVSLALLGLTVFLALIGLRSGSMHSPAIVMGNLGGGFCMLGLLGWMVFSEAALGDPRPAPRLQALTAITLLVLAVQILLGGFTSANFAALSCGGLPDCNGSYLPGPGLGEALNLGRSVEISEAGVAIGGPERAAIHAAHRIGAVLSLGLALVCGFLALAAPRTRAGGAWIIGLAVTVFALGVAAVFTDLPIFLAVAHNWLAALLLLAVIRLLAFSRQSDVDALQSAL
jgi:cytochrome c oxidase assembly protein subunit 15